MRMNVYGKNIEITDALLAYVQQRLDKLDRYFEAALPAQVVLSVEKERQTIEVTIPVDRGLLRAEETESSLYAAVDLVVDKLERQLHKYKSRLNHRLRHATLPAPVAGGDLPLDEDEEGVVREKRFALKPMTLEEAKMQLDLLGHDFFVFRDASTEGVQVLYKRRHGGYGLIVSE